MYNDKRAQSKDETSAITAQVFLMLRVIAWNFECYALRVDWTDVLSSTHSELCIFWGCAFFRRLLPVHPNRVLLYCNNLIAHHCTAYPARREIEDSKGDIIGEGWIRALCSWRAGSMKDPNIYASKSNVPCADHLLTEMFATQNPW